MHPVKVLMFLHNCHPFYLHNMDAFSHLENTAVVFVHFEFRKGNSNRCRWAEAHQQERNAKQEAVQHWPNGEKRESSESRCPSLEGRKGAVT